MEVDGIYRLFARPVALYNVQYVKYVNFGKATRSYFAVMQRL